MEAAIVLSVFPIGRFKPFKLIPALARNESHSSNKDRLNNQIIDSKKKKQKKKKVRRRPILFFPRAAALVTEGVIQHKERGVYHTAGQPVKFLVLESIKL
jgi:hypothetical protein